MEEEVGKSFVKPVLKGILFKKGEGEKKVERERERGREREREREREQTQDNQEIIPINIFSGI